MIPRRFDLEENWRRAAGWIELIVNQTINVNGKPYELDVVPDMPLLWVLRDVLGLRGTKYGCGMGLCGACTVHLNGAAVRSCITPISGVGSSVVTTIEGIGNTAIGKRVQRSWLEVDVVQCGYCQAGQIMSAAALLAKEKQPSDQAIDKAMSGNLCRCGTYNRIRAAIKNAADGLAVARPTQDRAT